MRIEIDKVNETLLFTEEKLMRRLNTNLKKPNKSLMLKVSNWKTE